MPTKIDPLFRVLAEIGFVDIFLPFIIVLTVSYALLERTRVLGVEKGHARHNLNAAVAVVIALFVVGSSHVLGITTSIIQYAGLFAVIILAVVLLLGLFGVQHLPENKWWNAVFFVVIMLVGGSVFYSMGWFGRGSDAFIVLFFVFFLLLFIIKVWLKDTPHSHAVHQHQGAVSNGQTTRNNGPNNKKKPVEMAALQQQPASPQIASEQQEAEGAEEGRLTVPTGREEPQDAHFGEESG
ncbi:hypothetical protein HY485_00855 [Candidatus Woesearchaeota archaeon]|nr:hypothetical protein [Candidatus Woesearchaeota archaeon]